MRNLFNTVSDFFKNDPNAVDDRGFTRLQNAIMANDLKKVNALIRAGADMGLKGKNVGSPPLHFALLLERQMIVLALLKAGADVNLKDASGQTPLHIAVQKGQEAFILALLKLGADPNIPDHNGRTPLHLVPKSSPQIVSLLAKHKAEMSARDKDGNTPLHLFLDYPEIAGQLLANGADPNVLNCNQVSPYMMMLDEYRLRHRPEMLQKMIDQKANIAAVNPFGETVLHLAARLEMEETFLHVVSKAELSAVDSFGNNVLHALVRTQNVLMVARVLERAPELVLEKNQSGFSPFDELVRCADSAYCPFGGKFIAVAKMLLTHKADPNGVDRKGRSLLHHAVVNDKIEFLEDLLLAGADPDLVDRDGKTALHIAIERRNIKAMDTLLDCEANPDMTDDRGWTILDRLAEKGDRDSSMVQRLIVAGGQYQKQLPLHPEMMRRQRVLDKGKPSGGHTSAPPRL